MRYRLPDEVLNRGFETHYVDDYALMGDALSPARQSVNRSFESCAVASHLYHTASPCSAFQKVINASALPHASSRAKYFS